MKVYAWALPIALAIGCDGGKSGPVSKASYDPEKSAQSALDEFDTNRDGFVAGAELDASPGLRACLGRADADRDKKLSKDEMITRFKTYADANFGASGINVRVSLNDSPVAGAKVTFVPEKFFDGSIKGGSGTTDATGLANIERVDGVPGLSPGLYRISIEGPLVPADYSLRPLLGHEVTADGRADGTIELRLVAKPK